MPAPAAGAQWEGRRWCPWARRHPCCGRGGEGDGHRRSPSAGRRRGRRIQRHFNTLSSPLWLLLVAAQRLPLLAEALYAGALTKIVVLALTALAPLGRTLGGFVLELGLPLLLALSSVAPSASPLAATLLLGAAAKGIDLPFVLGLLLILFFDCVDRHPVGLHGRGDCLMNGQLVRLLLLLDELAEAVDVFPYVAVVLVDELPHFGVLDGLHCVRDHLVELAWWDYTVLGDNSTIDKT